VRRRAGELPEQPNRSCDQNEVPGTQPKNPSTTTGTNADVGNCQRTLPVHRFSLAPSVLRPLPGPRRLNLANKYLGDKYIGHKLNNLPRRHRAARTRSRDSVGMFEGAFGSGSSGVGRLARVPLELTPWPGTGLGRGHTWIDGPPGASRRRQSAFVPGRCTISGVWGSVLRPGRELHEESAAAASMRKRPFARMTLMPSASRHLLVAGPCSSSHQRALTGPGACREGPSGHVSPVRVLAALGRASAHRRGLLVPASSSLFRAPR